MHPVAACPRRDWPIPWPQDSSEPGVQKIYKICPMDMWREAERAGIFRGMPVDHRDGYIHFSTAGQVAETAAKHFAGQDDLVLVGIDADALGAGAQMGALARRRAVPASLWRPAAERGHEVEPIPLLPDGRHRLPELCP